jgi:hypothetical protein
MSSANSRWRSSRDARYLWCDVAKTVNFRLGGVLEISEPEGGCRVTVRHNGFTITAWGENMAYTLGADQQVILQVEYVDANGNAATVDGPVQWDSSNPTIVTVTADAADDMRALVQAVGPVGNAQITATADADLGEGTRTLVTPMDVTVVAGEAVTGTITPVGPAEPIP